MKVLITDGLGSEAISTLRKLHEVDVQELEQAPVAGLAVVVRGQEGDAVVAVFGRD